MHLIPNFITTRAVPNRYSFGKAEKILLKAMGAEYETKDHDDESKARIQAKEIKRQLLDQRARRCKKFRLQGKSARWIAQHMDLSTAVVNADLNRRFKK